MNVDAEYVRTELLELVSAAMENGLAEYVGFDVTDGELTAESYDPDGEVSGHWRVQIFVSAAQVMSALTAPVEAGVQEYLHQPVNFSGRVETAEADAFRAAVDWTLAHTDWRVLGGLIPGMVEARHVRLGDVVRLSGGVSTVVGVRHHGTPGCVYVAARTEGGAEVPYELRSSERVRVDRAGVQS